MGFGSVKSLTLDCSASRLVEQGTELLSVRSDGWSLGVNQSGRIDFVRGVDPVGFLRAKLWDSAVIYPRYFRHSRAMREH